MIVRLLVVLIYLCCEVMNLPIETEFEVYNQSFTRIYTCPPNQSCRFVCNNVFNACLNTTFKCNHNNSCILDCISEASCCFSSLECSSNSSCILNCSGLRSCNFMREFCGSYDNGNENIWEDLPPNCHSVPYQFDLTSIDATAGLAASVGFATVGYIVENMVIVPDGSVQLLVKSFPDDKDIQSQLFSKIHEVGINVFKRISPPNAWTQEVSFPDVIFQKTHPLIVTAFFPNINQFMATTMYLVFKSLSGMLSLDNLDYLLHNNTINVQLNVGDTIIEHLDVINEYEVLIISKAFRYPNESFVKAYSYQVGPIVYSSIHFHEWNCSAPAPFYGAACLGKEWNSFGDQLVLYEDIIATLLEHFGTLIVTNILNILEGALSAQNSLVISNGVVLIVNSTISVGDDIHFSGGTLQIDVSSNISANNIIINEGNSIIINLDQQTYQNYLSTGNITIMPFKANNISGDFSQITFQGPNGTLDGCASSTHQGNTYFVTLSDCNNQISTNTPVLIGAIVGGVLSLAIVISFVYILVRIYNFQKSMKALEDTPPTQEEEPKTNPKTNPKNPKDITINIQKALNSS